MATVFNNPFEDGYIALTTLIPITGTACNIVPSINDGIQSVLFDPPLERHDVPGDPNSCRWCAWSGPPEGENPNPPVLFSSGQMLTMTLSQPARIFGFELMPNLQSADNPETHTVTVEFLSGATTVATIVKDLTVSCIQGNSGSRLFAVQTDDPNELCIDTVNVSVSATSSQATGFSIAQVRYALCCNTCEDLCSNREIPFTATFNTGVPFTFSLLGPPEFHGNFNDNVDCTTGTCLQSAILSVCNSTFECCVTLGTINFSGTVDLLITLPVLLDTDCGSEAVTLFDNVTVPISQTCFTCLGEEECPPNICELLEPIIDTFKAEKISDTEVVVSGTLLFNCPE